MINTMFGLILDIFSASLFLQENRKIKRRKKIDGAMVFIVILLEREKY
jgi:hypothetical protein